MPGSWVCVGGGGGGGEWKGALTGSNNFRFGTAGSAGRTGRKSVCGWRGGGVEEERQGENALHLKWQLKFTFPFHCFLFAASQTPEHGGLAVNTQPLGRRGSPTHGRSLRQPHVHSPGVSTWQPLWRWLHVPRRLRTHVHPVIASQQGYGRPTVST